MACMEGGEGIRGALVAERGHLRLRKNTERQWRYFLTGAEKTELSGICRAGPDRYRHGLLSMYAEGAAGPRTWASDFIQRLSGVKATGTRPKVWRRWAPTP